MIKIIKQKHVSFRFHSTLMDLLYTRYYEYITLKNIDCHLGM